MSSMTDSPKDAMEALTEMLANSPAEAGGGIEHLCKQSATKAVNEVLDVLLHGASSKDGIIRLRFTEISEHVLRDTVRKAIDGCRD